MQCKKYSMHLTQKVQCCRLCRKTCYHVTDTTRRPEVTIRSVFSWTNDNFYFNACLHETDAIAVLRWAIIKRKSCSTHSATRRSAVSAIWAVINTMVSGHSSALVHSITERERALREDVDRPCDTDCYRRPTLPCMWSRSVLQSAERALPPEANWLATRRTRRSYSVRVVRYSLGFIPLDFSLGREIGYDPLAERYRIYLFFVCQ